MKNNKFYIPLTAEQVDLVLQALSTQSSEDRHYFHEYLSMMPQRAGELLKRGDECMSLYAEIRKQTGKE